MQPVLVPELSRNMLAALAGSGAYPELKASERMLTWKEEVQQQQQQQCVLTRIFGILELAAAAD